MKIRLEDNGCLRGCGSVEEKPDSIPHDQAIRESLRNHRVGYWIGGCGYDYHLRPENILRVKEVPAPDRISGDEWKNNGRKFFKVEVQTCVDQRVLDVEVVL